MLTAPLYCESHARAQKSPKDTWSFNCPRSIPRDLKFVGRAIDTVGGHADGLGPMHTASERRAVAPTEIVHREALSTLRFEAVVGRRENRRAANGNEL